MSLTDWCRLAGTQNWRRNATRRLHQRRSVFIGRRRVPPGAALTAQLHTLILLSLGSLLNLGAYFDLPPGCHLHIIDAHRPWNLDNLFGLGVDMEPDGEGPGEDRIWVWGDGDEEKLDGVKQSWEALEVSCILYDLSRAGRAAEDTVRAI